MMQFLRGFLWMVALGSIAGCKRAPAREGADGGAAAPAPAVAPAKAAPICAPAEGTCVGDDEGARCVGSDDGSASRWEKVRCEASAVCLSGRCVDLPSATSKPWPEPSLTRDALGSLAPGRWINRWAMRAPVSARAADSIVRAIASGERAELEDTTSPVAHCSPSGFMSVPKGSSDAGTTYAVFSGTLLAPFPMDVDLHASAAGRVRVFLNGKKAMDLERSGSPAPMVDEDFAAQKLGAGATAVVVVVEQSLASTTGFYLRVSPARSSAAGELLFAPGATTGPSCPDADLVDVRFDPKPRAKGFQVGVETRLRGLAPRHGAKLSFVVERAPAKKSKHPKTMQVGRGEVGAPLVVGVEASKKRPFTLRVTLGDDVGASPRELAMSYRGELHERVVALAKRLDAVRRARAPEAAKESVEYHVEALVRAIALGDPDIFWIDRRADELERDADAVALGRDPFAKRTGIMHRAYRSRLDGSLQPYLLYVPPSVRPAGSPVPLVLAMHGLNGEPGQAMRTVVGEPPELENMNSLWHARHLPGIPNHGVAIAAPYAYGNSGQRLPGEDDVLRVVEEVRRDYPIDERRISITGYSLGGTVSFVVPLHYPGLFSAAAPLCGYPNLATWASIRDTPRTPWEDVLIARRAIVNYAENGRHLPLHIVHGGEDGPERSAVIADRYRELGYRRVFDVQKELDHNVWEYAYEKGRLIGWLRLKKRPVAPHHVRLVTGELRYDRAFWVRLLGVRDDTKFSRLDARWDESAKSLEVSTENVEAFALDVAALSAPREATLAVDGRAMGEVGGEETIFLAAKDRAFERLASEPPRTGKKRPRVAGPLDDVQRHATVVVYGTLDPGETEANRLAAEHAAKAPQSTLRFPVKADTEIDENDLGKTSLVLVGRPETNRITKALAEALPVRFEARALTLRGKRYEGEDLGVSLIYPNPKNPEEYVVLHAGTSARGTLASRHLPIFAPDFLVYDPRITAIRGSNLLGSAKVLAGGFFDTSWR
jgi:poly(3-hydroxybutyrate) depolymerase